MAHELTLLGAGWREDDLTLRAIRVLNGSGCIVLQTDRLGCARYLKEQGLSFETLDPFYEQAEDFDEFIESASAFLLARLEQGSLTYVVSELTDQVACALASRVPVRLIPGVQTGGELTAFAGSGLRVVSAIDYEAFVPQADVTTLVRELDSPMYACELKLKLMNCYPEEHAIRILREDGTVEQALLCDLDRLPGYTHQTCALIPAVTELTQLERFDFECLLRIVRRLRAFDGCPWDREQTHESLRACLIEEAYEAVDAINRGETDDLYDELGDVLLQVAFHSEIGREHGEFDASDVTTAICRKMIRRHPHVFAGLKADDLQASWDQIKREEQGGLSPADSLRQVARSLPALTRAKKVLTRAARAGLCGSDPLAAMERLEGALFALRQTLDKGESPAEAGGQALFELVNLLRIGQTDPEMLLMEQTDRALDEWCPEPADSSNSRS